MFQVGKIVCEFLQTMLSDMPDLLHLLLRQTIPTEALILLLDGVGASLVRHPPVKLTIYFVLILLRDLVRLLRTSTFLCRRATARTSTPQAPLLTPTNALRVEGCRELWECGIRFSVSGRGWVARTMVLCVQRVKLRM